MRMEIEKKFLVKMPDFAKLKKYQPEKKRIIQTYLSAVEAERRVRCIIVPWDDDDCICHFFYTTKLPVGNDGLTRKEFEESINYQVYNMLLKEADKNLKPIEKDRHVFYINQQKYELDIYDFDKNVAILEVELATAETNFEWPDELEKIADVTADNRFKNRTLAEDPKFPTISEFVQ